MKQIKSHFEFTKQQRNGIFLLLLLIIVFQCLYYYVDLPVEETSINQEQLLRFQSEVDSLKKVHIANSKPKIYPFNPNYISDYKGYTLGMSPEEIDRLLVFRERNKWVNSAKQFQEVTKVSDSLLAVISPYFKFPEWVTNPKPKSTFRYQNNNTSKTYAQKQDLNTATAQQLRRINGIGETLSERIIKFRNKTPGGFIADIQLTEVYGLSPEVIERLNNEFTVKTPKSVNKINVNTAAIEELVTVKYIDYEVAHYIIEYRTLREGFKTLDDLVKVKGFPVKKIEIIKLYLMLN